MHLFKTMVAFVLVSFSTVASAYVTDSEVAIVRDRYGGGNPLDVPGNRPPPDRGRGPSSEYYNYYRSNPAYQNAPPPVNPGMPSPYGPVSPYYPYGSSYFPPNQDSNPDETQFNQLYQQNSQTIGQ